MTIQSTVTSKGQTTVPRAVREALGLKPGDSVRWFIVDGQVRVMRKTTVSEVAGMLHRPGMRIMRLEEMDEAIAEGALESAL